MGKKTMREKLEAYAKQRYQVEAEELPFRREDYAVLRHADTGKWFAVFIAKEYSAFGLAGEGTADVLSVKPKDADFADFLMQQPGYLRGFPSKKWNWISMLLDGTVPYEEVCRRLDESFQITRSKTSNKKTPLLKRKHSSKRKGE
ncbi:MmcQ/YjbR family DNA-binding protein [Streptococcus sp. H49]|uniref:MmcQ/YjbR family DNA-binding protein n=1 Tax=Streptococcus huangxiaojuni TaxID=3237239 RepID=UPI0034A496FC